MSISRIKTLVITALLLINIFFLSVYATNEWRGAAERRSIANGVISAYEQLGVAVDCDIKIGAQPQSFRTVRDLFAELKTADALLGGCETADSSTGAVTRYDGKNGTAQFNALGEFFVEYTSGESVSADTVSTAERLFRALKIDADIISADENMVNAVLKHRGNAIYNCNITLYFDNGVLRTISGRQVTGIERGSQNQRFYDLQTLLMSVLASLKRGEIAFTQLLEVKQAFRFTSGASGEGELTPGWMITTDNGDWFADAATGRLEQANLTVMSPAVFALSA